jgi:CheY-like chemotaxis protein
MIRTLGCLAATAQENSLPQGSGADRFRILLVEDHEDSARVMSRVLQSMGHTVHIAGGVVPALSAAQAETFDVVICDIGLPDGSGLELMRRLRAVSPIRGIALSGLCCESDVQASLNAGFDRHLTKPVEMEDIESALRALIG